MQSSVLAQTPILSENIPQLEASNDDDHEVVMLGKSVERLRGKGIVPCEYDGASITPFDQSEEKKESEHTLFRGSDVQFLANEESKPFYSVFTSSASEVNEDKSPGGNRPVDALENKMQSAMSFDRESNDDDSSVSLSIGNENPYLWPARSWGGGLREDRKLIRKTLSWPGGAFDPRSNTRGCSGLHFDEKHLTSPATPTPKGLDRGLQNSISCSDSHGICHTFPSTDESLQVVVDEMMSRLSPITGARRKDTYISEDKNNEFLDNYLYCTKIDGDPKASGYKRPEEHICLDPCQGNEFLCHTLGVDTVCNGIQFIFDKQRVRPETAEATPRQRSLSLDNSLPKDSSINWLRSVQNLFRQVGSGLVPASEERQEAVQFEPPCLKKAALELE